MSTTETTSRIRTKAHGHVQRSLRDVRVAPAAASTGTDEDRAQPARRDHDEEVITRKTRGERTVDGFNIPANCRKKGWDYQWWAISVMGQAVDGGMMAEIHDGGWRPVKSVDMPQMVPPGLQSEHVERQGQRLYMRPMSLSHQAKDEDYRAAEQQKRDRIEGALGGRPVGGGGVSDVRGVRPLVETFSIEEEVGSRPGAGRGN
jgi:hypothetical protein